MHYGSEMTEGKMMWILMELLVLEIGMGTQPFQVNYANYGEGQQTHG
jgi:hypothetical protein